MHFFNSKSFHGEQWVFLPLRCWCQTLSVLLDVFSSSVKHFHFQPQLSVSRHRLTDWQIVCRPMSMFLWVSVCSLSFLPLFSLSDTIKQKHISKSSERGIFLSLTFSLQSALSLSLLPVFFSSVLPSRLALCVVLLRGYLFVLHNLLKCN